MTSPGHTPHGSTPPPQRPPPPTDSWLEADVTRRSLMRRGLVILLAVVVGALWLGIRPGPDAAVELVSPDPGARVEGGSTLIWRSVPGATAYRVDLRTESGRDLLSVEVADTILQLGSEVTSPGAAEDVLWRVTATVPDGVEWSGERSLVVGGR